MTRILAATLALSLLAAGAASAESRNHGYEHRGWSHVHRGWGEHRDQRGGFDHRDRGDRGHRGY